MTQNPIAKSYHSDPELFVLRALLFLFGTGYFAMISEVVQFLPQQFSAPLYLGSYLIIALCIAVALKVRVAWHVLLWFTSFLFLVNILRIVVQQQIMFFAIIFSGVLIVALWVNRHHYGLRVSLKEYYRAYVARKLLPLLTTLTVGPMVFGLVAFLGVIVTGLFFITVFRMSPQEFAQYFISPLGISIWILIAVFPTGFYIYKLWSKSYGWPWVLTKVLLSVSTVVSFFQVVFLVSAAGTSERWREAVVSLVLSSLLLAYLLRMPQQTTSESNHKKLDENAGEKSKGSTQYEFEHVPSHTSIHPPDEQPTVPPTPAPPVQSGDDHQLR